MSEKLYPKTPEEHEEAAYAEQVLQAFDRLPIGTHVQHTGKARIAVAKFGHLAKRLPPFVPPPGWFIDDLDRDE